MPGTVGREGKKLIDEIEDFLSSWSMASMLLVVGGADFIEARNISPGNQIKINHVVTRGLNKLFFWFL